MTFLRRLLAGTILALYGSASYAEDPSATDDWRFSLTPYLWLAGISADTASGGSDFPPINPDYSLFSLDNLDGAAFLAFAAAKGQWSVHSDLVYVSFADTFSIGPIEAGFDLEGGTLELSAGYRPASWQNTELLFGLRGVELRMDTAFTPGPAGSVDASFVDPIVGVRYQRTFSNKWGLYARGDVGRGTSEGMVNAELAGSYQFTDTFTLLFGYRYLEIDFEDSDFLLDLSIQGYSVGFEFNW